MTVGCQLHLVPAKLDLPILQELELVANLHLGDPFQHSRDELHSAGFEGDLRQQQDPIVVFTQLRYLVRDGWSTLGIGGEVVTHL